MTCDKKLINEVKHMRPKICVPTLYTLIQTFISIRELCIKEQLTYALAVYTSAYIQIWGKRNAPYNQAHCIPLPSWKYNATRNILYTSDIYDTPKPVY